MGVYSCLQLLTYFGTVPVSGMDGLPPHSTRRRLSSSDAEIRQLARLIAVELAALGERSARLLTAAEVAERYGLTRAWVYKHSRELGAHRMGSGPKAPLRFDAAEISGHLGDIESERHTGLASSAPRPSASRVELLPIGARRAPRRHRSVQAQTLGAG
jgi:hypothetical protein